MAPHGARIAKGQGNISKRQASDLLNMTLKNDQVVCVSLRDWVEQDIR